MIGSSISCRFTRSVKGVSSDRISSILIGLLLRSSACFVQYYRARPSDLLRPEGDRQGGPSARHNAPGGRFELLRHVIEARYWDHARYPAAEVSHDGSFCRGNSQAARLLRAVVDIA